MLLLLRTFTGFSSFCSSFSCFFFSFFSRLAFFLGSSSSAVSSPPASGLSPSPSAAFSFFPFFFSSFFFLFSSFFFFFSSFLLNSLFAVSDSPVSSAFSLFSGSTSSSVSSSSVRSWINLEKNPGFFSFTSFLFSSSSTSGISAVSSVSSPSSSACSIFFLPNKERFFLGFFSLFFFPECFFSGIFSSNSEILSRSIAISSEKGSEILSESEASFDSFPMLSRSASISSSTALFSSS